MVQCSLCGKELKDEAVFCNNCGAVKCTVCGEFNEREAKKCTKCNNPLNVKVEATPSTKEIVDKYKDDLVELGGKVQENMIELKQKGVQAYHQMQEDREEKKQNIRETNFVELADGEVIVKKYFATRLLAPSVEGYLTVTNKRVIFHGKGASSKVVSEVPVDSVGAILTYYGRNFKWGLIIFGVILALLSLSIMEYKPFPGLILLAVGCLLVFLGIKKTFVLSISSNKAMGSPILIGAGAKSVAGNAAALSLEGDTTPETENMMQEIGALVLDLQQMGDLAIEKWKNK